MFHAAQAQETNQDNGSYVAMASALEKQLMDHPTLRQSAARSCRAIFVLGQRKAQTRLDLSASLSGERQLASRFKNNSDDGVSSASRGFNRRLNDVYDLELVARYRLYDWGVGDARVQSETHRLHAERLNHEANLMTLVEDLLRVAIQLQSAIDEADYYRAALGGIAPHVMAIEAQGKAGSIGLAAVRETKLSVLNAEVALQRAERRVAEISKELQSQFKLDYDDVMPLLADFMAKRADMVTPIDAAEWLQVRVLDSRIAGQREDLHAIENERYPQIDSVLETTLFDVTNLETEYQLVGRLEFNLPLYDGGSNKARAQEKSWQVKELTSQRDEQI